MLHSKIVYCMGGVLSRILDLVQYCRRRRVCARAAATHSAVLIDV